MSATGDLGVRIRYTVSTSDSGLTFQAKSTLHPVTGKANALEGYVDAEWSPEGMPITQPAPAMHVEFPVEQLRSGNAMQDREMWKVVDSKRFPRISADLRALSPAGTPGRYVASGDVTMAGRSRKYEGELAFAREAARITVDGELNVDIRDFGLKPPNLFVIKVEPIVKVRLHLVALEAA